MSASRSTENSARAASALITLASTGFTISPGVIAISRPSGASAELPLLLNSGGV